MSQSGDMTDEERFERLEHDAAETRKMFFGALSIAKEMWQDDFLQRPEGVELLHEIEKAAESFIDLSQQDRFKRFEQTLHVASQRAKSIFDLVTYAAKYRK